MQPSKIKAIGVLTSGGDAPGMNAAVRAVVRMGLKHELEVYGIQNGWQGAVAGGDRITKMSWWSVGGVLQRGGTFLGTARCQEFRERAGRRQAAVHLYQLGIDALVVIGGDGSLTGARLLAEEWPELLREAAAQGQIVLAEAAAPTLAVVGLPGSIDNDTFGSDMSIGADTALHRIVTAADQLVSTASAHQRTFVMEVMGRNCGYLALASALASGAHWVLIPEQELESRWHQDLVSSLKQARAAGREHAIIMIAEGARHPDGLPLEASAVQEVLAKRLGADTRVTVLGHVQRGGAPSAFDRVLSTRLGAAAVADLMQHGADVAPRMLGIVNNEVAATPLREMVEKSQAVGERIEEGDYEAAVALRGHSFQEQLRLLKLLTQSAPAVEATRGNLLLLTAGHDAPGMNACLRVVTRVALNSGYRVWAATYGCEGLLAGKLRPLQWMDVTGWASRGGSEIGAGWYDMQPQDLPHLAAVLAEHEIAAVVAIGGADAYHALDLIAAHQTEYPALQIPMVAIPASINNNLPGTDFTIGADSALNNIVSALDKIKDTAGANRRAFIVEVMGWHSGYLALMAALASGAEQAYLPEEGVNLQGLMRDVEALRQGFERGKRLSLLILNEVASRTYDLDTIRRIMEEEGGALFDVRTVILGHLQRGGAPSPFDRILAARLGAAAIDHLNRGFERDSLYRCIGLQGKRIASMDIRAAMQQMDWPHERPRQEWFMTLCDLARSL